MRDSKRHIRQQIQRPGSVDHAPPSHPLLTILNGLNIADSLTTGAPHYLHKLLHYGPRAYTGKTWAAILIWMRESGYYSYQELTLFGVWAQQQDDQIQILIGVRHLHYSAPVFNAESYQKIIRQNFTTYYGDDGHPPHAGELFFQTAYDPLHRLGLRQEIATELTQGFRRIQ